MPVEASGCRVRPTRSRLRASAAVVRAQRPAILHTHLVHADFHGLPPAALARVPVLVSTKHGFNPFRSSRAFAVADRAVGSARATSTSRSRAGSPGTSRTAEGFAEESFTVIHYGIEPGPEPEPYAGDAPRLLCVGRLVPIKGHDVLLRAFVEARRAVPGLTLDLAGSGPLEAGAARAERTRSVWTEPCASSATSRRRPLTDASFVVVPSLGEGFGMVALEAMERGRAVVASAVGGLPEIVAHGETGLVVPPGDADALAAAIVELASDPARARALGEAGRRRALAEFRQERCTERHERLYRAALARAGLGALLPHQAHARSSAKAASSASRKSNGAR